MYKFGKELILFVYNIGVNYGYRKGLSKKELDDKEMYKEVEDFIKKYLENRNE